MTQQQATEWLERIVEDGVNLTPWEEDFVASLKDQLARGRAMSDRQAEIVERIYTERVP